MKSSLIIVTRNRRNQLKKCLNSIKEQIQLPDEIVIVDNNSIDNTKDIINQFKIELINKTMVKYVFEEKVSIGNARKRGISETSGDIILFTDDDCELPKNWIKAHFELHLVNKDVLVIGGRLKFKKENWLTYACQIMADNYIAKGVVEAKFINPTVLNYISYTPIKLTIQCFSTKLFTANISYKKKLFLDYGNFSELFIAGEENEFHEKIYKQNRTPFLFNPDLEVQHDSFGGLNSVMNRYYYYAYFDYISSGNFIFKKMIFTMGNIFLLMLKNFNCSSLVRSIQKWCGLFFIALALIGGHLKGIIK